MTRRQLLANFGTSLLLVAGCAGEGSSRSIDVFAAASLTDAFAEVAGAFEEANPGTAVALNVAGSSALVEQILGGAPADVLASADESDMARVVEAGDAREPVTFARNSLQIAVPAGNEAGITGLADFARGGLLLGLCAAEVPCGQFARRALAAGGVNPDVDTEEPDVRSLLTKVQSGDLDAGIVYRTDVVAADRVGRAVEGIDIPDDSNVVAACSIAVLTEAPDAEGAAAFVAFVLGEEGQAILERHGFERP